MNVVDSALPLDPDIFLYQCKLPIIMAKTFNHLSPTLQSEP